MGTVYEGWNVSALKPRVNLLLHRRNQLLLVLDAERRICCLPSSQVDERKARRQFGMLRQSLLPVKGLESICECPPLPFARPL